jgi:hypothetical protein
VLVQTDCARVFTAAASTTVCVEVKPKAALTSISRLVPPAICAALEKFSASAYALENPPNPVSPLPRYAPADLLSCDPPRIAAALDALRRRRAHSLRVFRDGAVALADDLPISPSLHGDRDTAYAAPENRAAIDAAAVVLAAQPGVVLGILGTQRRDYVDALGAEKVYAHLVRACCGGDAAAAERAVWDAYFDQPGDDPPLDAAVADARARISYADSGEARRLHNDARFRAAEAAVANMCPRVAARVVADFMVASVVKDCSIMVSMSCRPPGYVAEPAESAVTLGDGTVCLYRVSVVDLEPKPLSKLHAWAARDRGFVADRAAAAAVAAAVTAAAAAAAAAADAPGGKVAPAEAVARSQAVRQPARRQRSASVPVLGDERSVRAACDGARGVTSLAPSRMSSFAACSV